MSAKHKTDQSDSSLAEQTGSAFLWNGSGIAAEKIIFLLRIVVLARLLAPEDFGLVAIGLTVTAFVNRVTDFGLVPALIQSPSDDKVHLDTAWTIGLLRGIGINIVLFIAAPYIAAVFEEPSATNLIRVLALATLARAAASIKIADITRNLQFRDIAAIRIGSALVNTLISIYLAPAFGPWALVWGAVAGAIAFLIGSYIVAPYRPAFRLSTVASDRVFRFGRWIFIIGVLGIVGESLLRWIVSTRLGLTELGLFFMASRLAYLPAQLTTELLNQVAFPIYSRLQHNQIKMARVFRSMLVSLLVLLVPVAAIFLVLTPDIVEYVLGHRWNGTTAIMQAFVCASVIGIVGEAATPLLKGIGTPSKIALLDMIRVATLVVAAWILIGSQGLVGIGIAEIIATVITQLIVIYILREAIDKPFLGLMPVVFAVTCSAIAGAMIATYIISSMPNLFGLAIAVGASALASIAVGILLDRALGIGLLRMLAEPFPQLAQLVNRPIRRN